MAAISKSARGALCTSLVAALACACFEHARGDNLSWLNPNGGVFDNPSNWFPGSAPPTWDDLVRFSLGTSSSYVVNFPGNSIFDPPKEYWSNRLHVRDQGVTFSGSTQPFSGNSTYTLTSTVQTEADRPIMIGLSAGENAHLSLSHAGVTGGFLTKVTGAAATIGDAAGAVGRLDVATGMLDLTGSDFNWYQLIVGKAGTGTLNITNGADVKLSGLNGSASVGRYPGSVGTVNINGAGSTMTIRNQLRLGEQGSATLNIQNGGSLATQSASSIQIGESTNAVGEVTITGTGSRWTANGAMYLGITGQGRMTIANNGTFVNNSMAPVELGAGSNGNGELIVTDPGSWWSTPGLLHVGNDGKGTLQVLNGGYLQSGTAKIGGSNMNSGEVTVSGDNSNWWVTSGSLEVGFQGPGNSNVLNIGPGAVVEVTHDIHLDKNGVLRLQGGTLLAESIGVNDTITGQYEGTFQWTSGTLVVNGVLGDATNQAGRLSPGRAIGRTAIIGNYTQQAAASMDIEIGGTTPIAEHDQVYVDGFASLGGDLRLALANGFKPQFGQTFTILESAGGISGAFSNVANGQRVADESGTHSFKVNYGLGSPFNPDHIVLSEYDFQPYAADFNEDGRVNKDDLANWRMGFGVSGNADHQDGDADGDHDVDGADFLTWQRQLSLGEAIGLASPTVPEPGTLLLTSVAVFGAAASARALRRSTRPRYGTVAVRPLRRTAAAESTGDAAYDR